MPLINKILHIGAAKLLLRFDDITPFMNWETWNQIEDFLDTNDIKPLVAIVPKCKDPLIMHSLDGDEEYFWNRVKAWEVKGWTIALHGYTHVFTNNNSGIVGLNKYSEFAGLPRNHQDKMIQNALEIFSSNQCKQPVTWVAPAHSFDNNTISVLESHGFKNISDTFSLFPYNYKGLLWVPQQLWRFRKMFFGVWTVCFHHNSWSIEDLVLFQKNILKYKKNIVGFTSIIDTYKYRSISVVDKSFILLYRAVLYLKLNIIHQKDT